MCVCSLCSPTTPPSFAPVFHFLSYTMFSLCPAFACAVPSAWNALPAFLLTPAFAYLVLYPPDLSSSSAFSREPLLAWLGEVLSFVTSFVGLCVCFPGSCHGFDYTFINATLHVSFPYWNVHVTGAGLCSFSLPLHPQQGLDRLLNEGLLVDAYLVFAFKSWSKHIACTDMVKPKRRACYPPHWIDGDTEAWKVK